VSASCSEDDFAADNTRYAAVHVRPQLKAAIVGTPTPTSKIWSRALHALGVFHVEHHASLNSLDGTWDGILIPSWDGSDAAYLKEAALAGTVVLISPAEHLNASKLPVGPSNSDGSSTTSDALIRLTGSDPTPLHLDTPDDPLFTLFSEGAYGDPARGAFQTRLSLPTLKDTDATTLLSYADGIPALARVGKTPLFIWNLDLESKNTDWPQNRAFLPLFGELFLGERSRLSGSSFSQPGIPITMDLPSGVPFEIRTSPESTPQNPRVESISGTSGELLPIAPCILEWKSQETERSGMRAINLAAVESNLKPLDTATTRQYMDRTVESGQRARDLREGVEWWPWILALVLVWVLAEMLALWFWEGRA
jgi:hypothetical protein